MIKNYYSLIVTILSVVALISLNQMVNRAKTNIEECIAAQKVIEKVRNDNPDYFYDVLVETDEYQDYVEILYNNL